MTPDVGKYLYLTGYLYPHLVIILVVCPLKSLVDSHIRELRNRVISAASLSVNEVDLHNLLKEAYAFLFVSSSYKTRSGQTQLLRPLIPIVRCG